MRLEFIYLNGEEKSLFCLENFLRIYSLTIATPIVSLTARLTLTGIMKKVKLASST